MPCWSWQLADSSRDTNSKSRLLGFKMEFPQVGQPGLWHNDQWLPRDYLGKHIEGSCNFPMQRISLALVLLLGCAELGGDDGKQYKSWSVYLGDHSNSHYSALDQINRSNVSDLGVAWVYSSGDGSNEGRSQIQCNPIVVDTVLYATSPHVKALAIHSATGQEIWRFDPFASGAVLEGPGINRGLTYWSGDRKDPARVFLVAGARLFALDAETGEPIDHFGSNGSVDLRMGLGRDVTGLSVSARTPGIIFENLLILGSNVSEGPVSAPGHIRAYNVGSGKLEWVFHTIPQPGEIGHDTWPEEAYQYAGGANSWAGFALDEKDGTVFAPTGSAAFDFWGGNRHGENLFANSLLALDARTGERKWHYQIVRHDIWDRDLPAPPNLVTVSHDGNTIEAVAQVTKSGHLFLLDRSTGDPLFPVEEKVYPSSELRGENVWPTQRLPVIPAPFSRQRFDEDDITDISPEAHAYVRERFKTVRSNGQFVPPSIQGTMIFPGFDGGAEWGGAAVDPMEAVLYVNSNEMPWILTMVELDSEASLTGSGLYAAHCANCHGSELQGSADGSYPPLADLMESRSREEIANRIRRGMGRMPSFGFLTESQTSSLVDFLTGEGEDSEVPGDTDSSWSFAGSPYGHTGYNRFFDQEGYPAVKPPWGLLSAINLNTGEYEWQVPLGEFSQLTARGIPVTGTENYGGPVVTAGGLLFIAASKDERFRAFDKDTGVILWETQLPAGGYATPATYEVNDRQYVVVAAGGGKMGTKSGDSYIAFALPR